MAVKRQLDQLLKGAINWNAWREQNRDEPIDLSRANLSRVDLLRTGLTGANLSGVNLRGSCLAGANLSQTNFVGTNLTGADLRGAELAGANLSGANLSGVDFTLASLSEADLSNARIGVTIFGRVDLSQTKGLQTMQHFCWSVIGIDTIYISQGKIPEIFLRQAGVQESFIKVMAAITQSTH